MRRGLLKREQEIKEHISGTKHTLAINCRLDYFWYFGPLEIGRSTLIGEEHYNQCPKGTKSFASNP